MDVNQPKLHNCRGSKFIDYEVIIEVGSGENGILHCLILVYAFHVKLVMWSFFTIQFN